MNKILLDPFRLFFPMGVLFALAGIGPWVFLLSGSFGYPAAFHRQMMIDGFLLSFVAGFLMTAIPRFTKTENARPWEVAGVAILLCSAAWASYGESNLIHWSASLGALLMVALFAFRRVRRRAANPPPTFVFVGVGLGLWVLSLVRSVFVALEWTSDSLIWRDLFSNGALMCLILGIGSRLIPALLGWREVVDKQRREGEVVKLSDLAPRHLWILIGLFILSYLLADFSPWSLLLRSAVVGYFAFVYWRLHRLPRDRNPFTWSLWITAWMIFFGVVMELIPTGYHVHMLHGLLIGGISLLTLLIGLHVVCAHMASDIQGIKARRLIWLLTGLLLSSMFTRVTAIFWPAIYLNHLAYAATTWIAGLLIWLYLLWQAVKRSTEH